MKIKICGLPPLLLMVLVSCQEKSPEPASFYVEQIRVAVVNEELVSPEYRSYGTVAHLNKADVYPSTEGNIEELDAEEGMAVEKGQILAQLDRRRLLIRKKEAEADIGSQRAQLRLAEEKLKEGEKAVEAKLIAIRNAESELEQKRIELENIQTTYASKQRLFEVEGVSREELERIKTQYLSARTEVEQAEGELEIQRIGFRDRDLRNAGYAVPSGEEERRKLLILLNTRMLAAERQVAEAELNAALANLQTIELLLAETTIRAPIAGIVAVRYAELGEKATPEQTLFTIFNTDAVYIQVDVSEKDLPRIQSGQKAIVLAEHSSKAKLEGQVRLISPYIDPSTRTARVRILLNNLGQELSPGMFVRLRIITGKPTREFLIPESAILEEPEGGSYVYLVRNRRLFRHSIEVGSAYGEKVVVRSGLEKGERVVLEPSPAYRNGMQVEVLDE